MTEQRSFLFLQGPPGPLFHLLALALGDRGIKVYRINLSGGDRGDWPGEAIDFRGLFSDWPGFFDRILGEQGITDLLMFGDCRPCHVAAHGIAGSRGVRIHVLEEGYLRPDWMTLERDGVNALSPLPRDPEHILAAAALLNEPKPLPPITASFRRRARDSYTYYLNVLFGALRFPGYRNHRSTPILVEGLGWLWKLLGQPRRARRAALVLRQLADRPMFVLPLQLSGDYQIRAHSCFADMQSAASYVIESFAAHAPPANHLLLKAHPLDCGFFDWARFTRLQACRHGIEGRLHHVDGGELEGMARAARGMVCVNSTSATLALALDKPVCAIGEAIYAMPGLTHQGHLDDFWRAPTPPLPGLYPAFKRVLLDRCLVRGGLSSGSAVAALVESMVDRLERI